MAKNTFENLDKDKKEKRMKKIRLLFSVSKLFYDFRNLIFLKAS